MIDQETTKITTTKKTCITKTKLIETMSTKLLTDKDLSTDIAADAASDIKAATPKAVVDYTASNPVIPALAAGQIAFGDAAGKLTGSENLKWDKDNQRLSDGGSGGIEIVAADTKLNIINNSGNPLSISSPNAGGIDIFNGTVGDQSGVSFSGATASFTGQLLLQSYVSGDKTGDPSYNLQLDAEGNVIQSTGYTGDVVAAQTMTFENGILKTVV